MIKYPGQSKSIYPQEMKASLVLLVVAVALIEITYLVFKTVLENKDAIHHD